MKKKVLGIVGPTASGKTALSLLAAGRLGGEILCMDSMQIYRGMDIGTAKPTQEERTLIPHHLVDILPPDASFSVAQYAEAARKLIDAIPRPILVGGTGQYLQALSLPMDYGTVGGDEAIRAKYHALAQEKGIQAVHDRLSQLDPISAARLHPNDLKRVIRALEVYELTGVPLSEQTMPDESEGPYDMRLYALDLPRDVLYDRINRRVDQMIRDGLLEEVHALMARGVPREAQAMQGLGYKEMLPVLDGALTVSEAAELIKTRTRHYAKRQLTWFKRDQRIRWLPWQPGDSLDPLADRICEEYLA